MSADDKTGASHNNMCLDVKGQDYSQNAAHIVIRNGDQFSETFVKWGDGCIALDSLGYKRVMCLDGTARKHLLAPAKHACKSSVAFQIVLPPLAQIPSTDPTGDRRRTSSVRTGPENLARSGRQKAESKLIKRPPLIQDRIDSESFNTFAIKPVYCRSPPRLVPGLSLPCSVTGGTAPRHLP